MRYIVRMTTICSECGASIRPGRDISVPRDWTYEKIDSSTPCNKIICPQCCGNNATEKYYKELVNAGFCRADGVPLPPRSVLQAEWLEYAIEEYLDGVRLNTECKKRGIFFREINITFLDKPVGVCEEFFFADNIVLQFSKDWDEEKHGDTIAAVCMRAGISFDGLQGRCYLRCNRDEFEHALHRFIRAMIAIDAMCAGDIGGD
jgi:hypothetical protein